MTVNQFRLMVDEMWFGSFAGPGPPRSVQVSGKGMAHIAHRFLQVSHGGTPFGFGLFGHLVVGSMKVSFHGGYVVCQVLDKAFPGSTQSYNLSTQPGHFLG
jgi:hypothetical protein